MEDKEIEKYIIENELGFTNNPQEAIYILRNGKMIDGEFDCGIRGLDHGAIEGVIGSRYDDDFKSKLFYETGMVQLIPETQMALIMEGQILTNVQRKVMNCLNYDIEEAYIAYASTSINLHDSNKINFFTVGDKISFFCRHMKKEVSGQITDINFDKKLFSLKEFNNEKLIIRSFDDVNHVVSISNGTDSPSVFRPNRI